jgi:RND family efflux transporter MFP subunit
MAHLMNRGCPFLLLLVGSLCAGCARTQGQQGPPSMPPPEVHVSLPITNRQVTDYEDFPGRIMAINDVIIRARVTGYLVQANFKEGADVQKDDVLFEIDPRPYTAELMRADGNVLQAKGHLKRLDADYQRAAALFGRGALGREDFDKVSGDRTEAAGALEVAKANLELAKLNLEYTKVRAPMNGRIGRRFIDPGNLVKADDTSLTTIVSLDPVYSYFNLDERSTLKAQQLIREGKVEWNPDVGMPVWLGLANEDDFPRKDGKIKFADNRVDPDTGTWQLRAIFANPDKCLTPGLFVRIRLPVGNPYTPILITEEALGTDQGQKFVYVVDDAGKVDYRRVKVGRLHDGLRVITEGLAPREKVVVSGLQRVRPGIVVKPEVVPMPGVAKQGDKETGGQGEKRKV